MFIFNILKISRSCFFQNTFKIKLGTGSTWLRFVFVPYFFGRDRTDPHHVPITRIMNFQVESQPNFSKCVAKMFIFNILKISRGCFFQNTFKIKLGTGSTWPRFVFLPHFFGSDRTDPHHVPITRIMNFQVESQPNFSKCVAKMFIFNILKISRGCFFQNTFKIKLGTGSTWPRFVFLPYFFGSDRTDPHHVPITRIMNFQVESQPNFSKCVAKMFIFNILKISRGCFFQNTFKIKLGTGSTWPQFVFLPYFLEPLDG